MPELATKADLLALKRELQNNIAELRADSQCLEVTVWVGVICAVVIWIIAIL